MTRQISILLLTLSLLWTGTEAQAQMPTAPQALSGTGVGFQKAAIQTGLGWTQYEEDHFLALNLGTVLDFGPLKLGLHVPLAIRVIDNGEEDAARIRSEDWDEVSEWFRVIRFIEYGDRYTGPFYIRYGELVAASLGHGTIVDAYYNNVDTDHYQGGIQTRFDVGGYGGEILIDNLVSPEIFGLRGFIRPLRDEDNEVEMSDKLGFGVSFVVDRLAPYQIQTRSDDPNATLIALDDSGVPKADTEFTGILGVDAELPLVHTESVQVVPYADINYHLSHGMGFHIGLRNIWVPTEALKMSFRAEYQLLGPGYLPSYISPLYEVERFLYPHERGTTKLAWLDAPDVDETAHGWVLDLGASIFDAIQIRGRYQGSGRFSDDSVWVQASLPYLGSIQASATYLKTDASGLSDVFDLDGAMLIAQARYKLMGPLALQAMFIREWHVVDDADKGEMYETINNWQAGVVAEFSY
jgi:hypothetical protein